MSRTSPARDCPQAQDRDTLPHVTPPRRHPAPDLDALVAQIGPIVATYPEIAAAYLFGSVARGEAGPASDLDLGVVFRRRGDRALDHYWSLADLAVQLEGVGGFTNVDVVALEELGPLFRHQALLEGRCVHEADRERRIDFETDACAEAFDFAPTHAIADREFLGGVRRWLQRRAP